MLDRVRDIGLAALDPGLVDAAVEHLAGRADERMAGKVLGVAGLLSDEHHRRPLRPLAEHGLRRVAVKRAGGAFGRGLAQLVEVRLVRDQRAGGAAGLYSSISAIASNRPISLQTAARRVGVRGDAQSVLRD